MKRARLISWLGAVAFTLAGVSAAHGPEAHSPGAEPSPIQAPGLAELDFVAPEPGSYALPPLRDAGDGELLDGEARVLRLHDLLGDRLVLLSFVYTSCSDASGCPLASAVLQQVQRRLRDEPELASRVRLISLSFDPVRDTPEVMQRYAEGLRREGPEWRFLTTASEAQLAPLLEAYGQSLVKEYDEAGAYRGAISHVLRVFLIDRQRRVRNIYGVSFLHLDTLINDMKTLLLESPAQPTRVSPADAGVPRPGDLREGYESAEYRSSSLALLARTGEPVDLLARANAGALGLPPLSAPADNPLTAQKVALGRKLFYDRRLSLNGTVSCAMCHIPEQGFTSNELATAIGLEGRTVRRNAPTLYNVAYLPRLFHDARETRLEQQVWGPLLARNEMANPSVGVVIEKLEELPDYAGRFEAAFPGRGPDMLTIGNALASYQRTLVSGGSAFDRWYYGKDAGALGPAAQRGFALFSGKAACIGCHPIGPQHAVFSDAALHNTGIGYRASNSVPPAKQRVQVSPGEYVSVDRQIVASVAETPPGDLGRYEISQDPADRWKYRTPTLRNVALSAPYMHDGSLATLREVVEFYDRGGVPNELLDPRIRPLGLSESEVLDLVAFLESLTGDDVGVLVRDAFAASGPALE